MHTRGNVKITEPGMRIDGSRADVYNKEDRKVIYDSNYRMCQQHAHGQLIQ